MRSSLLTLVSFDVVCYRAAKAAKLEKGKKKKGAPPAIKR
jgi:hypothetical protein